MFDFAQALLDYPNHTATLWTLAREHHLPWPEQREAVSSDVLDRAAQFYADRLTAPVLRYLAGRGFPGAFVRQRRIGYAPVSSSRDLLVRQIRGAPRANGPQVLHEAIEAGLVFRTRRVQCETSSPARLRGIFCSRTWFTAAWWISRAARIPRRPAVARISTGRAQSGTSTTPGMPGSGL